MAKDCSLKFCLLLAVMVFCLIGFAYAAEENNLDSSVNFENEVVDIEVAKLAASDYLQKIYPGKWEFFTFLPAYDLESSLAAYIIVFRDFNSSVTTMASLETTLQSIRNTQKQLKDKKNEVMVTTELGEDEKNKEIKNIEKYLRVLKMDLYLPDTFATVMTGANYSSEILLRCHKGLPKCVVEKSIIKEDLEAIDETSNMTLGKLIYISPTDIRYEVFESEDDQGSYKDIMRFSLKTISESYITSSTSSNKNLEKISDKRKIANEKKIQEEKEFSKMRPEHRQTINEGKLKRAKHNRDKWGSYKKEN